MPPARALPFLVLAALGVFAALLAMALFFTGGRLAYSLDDPYIHLALAENLLSGHYGLHPSESAAPSSSILFPFLLVPGLALGLGGWTPLLLNLACLLLLLPLLERWRRTLGWDEVPLGRMTGLLLAILLVICLNGVGVAFTGMEHSAHVLVSFALFLEILELARGEAPSPWLHLLLLLNPLLRFEGVAATAAAWAVLALLGRWRFLFSSLVLVAGVAGVYGGAMHHLGLPLLPSSVQVKSRLARLGLQETGAFLLALETGRHFLGNLLSFRGGVAALLLALALFPSRPTRESRVVTLYLGVMTGLHLTFGEFGWFGRYELYLLFPLTAGVLWVWRERIGGWISQGREGPLLWGLLLVPGLFFPTLYATLNTPLACHNIFSQHYQMHRFAVEFLRAPVAVNDLGWVSYENPHYVLDLWGLGSEEARRRRFSERGGRWMAELAVRHGVHVAMLYADWFNGPTALPESWTAVARLHLGGPRITPGASVVTFHALPGGDREKLEQALTAFGETLPAGVVLDRIVH